MKVVRRGSFGRQFKASWRDTLLLLVKFRAPLFGFFILIIGSGIVYYFLCDIAGNPLNSIPESIYFALTMVFLQPFGPFPTVWYLQIFFFMLPILGIAILAQGLTDFGVLFFNRRARGKEWEMAIASTMNHHIVLVGLGHLGFRVAQYLHDMNEDIVVIDYQPKPDLLNAAQSMGIPVIQDDATRDKVLEGAGIQKANSILLCTQNDSLNLQIALKARSKNPTIDVVIRIFEDDFADSLRKQFGFRALSATSMAAPVFAATAADIDVTPPLTIEGQLNSLARIVVSGSSKLIHKTVDEIEDRFQVSIMMIKHKSEVSRHPRGEHEIQSKDVIVLIGSPGQINALIHENHK